MICALLWQMLDTQYSNTTWSSLVVADIQDCLDLLQQELPAAEVAERTKNDLRVVFQIGRDCVCEQ
jgi:hypothetical protein